MADEETVENLPAIVENNLEEDPPRMVPRPSGLRNLGTVLDLVETNQLGDVVKEYVRAADEAYDKAKSMVELVAPARELKRLREEADGLVADAQLKVVDILQSGYERRDSILADAQEEAIDLNYRSIASNDTALQNTKDAKERLQEVTEEEARVVQLRGEMKQEKIAHDARELSLEDRENAAAVKLKQAEGMIAEYEDLVLQFSNIKPKGE